MYSIFSNDILQPWKENRHCEMKEKTERKEKEREGKEKDGKERQIKVKGKVKLQENKMNN